MRAVQTLNFPNVTPQPHLQACMEPLERQMTLVFPLE